MSQTLSIEVTPPGGSAQVFTVEGGHARIGSAAYCEIRLPLGDAAEEHVALDVTSDGIVAKALATTPAARIDGEPFRERVLSSESVLEIAETKVRVAVLGNEHEGKSAKSGRRTSPWLYVAAPVLIAYAVSELPQNSGSDERAPRQAPALFSQAESCPETEATSARAFGRERLSLADAKRERRPFHAVDGVRAVHLYLLAAACLERAADPAATEARAAASRLQTDLEESYRTHRVRLEHALAIQDYLVARREVQRLLDLTADTHGDYLTWLRSLDRRLRLRQEEKT